MATKRTKRKPPTKPSKFTAARRKKILKLIAEDHLPPSVAARCTGVCKTTLSHWRRFGRTAIEEEEEAAEKGVQVVYSHHRGEEFARFQEAIEEACATMEAGLLTAWREAGITDWRAAQQYLATIKPDEYSQHRETVTAEVTSGGDKPQVIRVTYGPRPAPSEGDD